MYRLSHAGRHTPGGRLITALIPGFLSLSLISEVWSDISGRYSPVRPHTSTVRCTHVTEPSPLPQLLPDHSSEELKDSETASYWALLKRESTRTLDWNNDG
ncbi:hypothetical protein J6590_008828 [Homalodisca vitripennis]|nr:hypothetical protein J6590_008828 [Homalodisca vitripennis]